MDHFVDIRLCPDPELAPAHLMDALFGKLHLALAARRSGDIGISFPGVASAGGGLGAILRLHGRPDALDDFENRPWLAGVRDHVDMAAMAPVPSGVRHRVVRRVQAKSSAERIRRRQMRRHGYDEAQARERVPDSIEQVLALPYVNVRSLSTGQGFRLFIAHGPLLDTPQAGVFSAYVSHPGRSYGRLTNS